MIQNYIKIAWRNLVKCKLYSVINITGLAVGIVCCLLIGLYVYEETRFDRFHEKVERIYRINETNSNENQQVTSARTPAPLAGFLEERYPKIEQVVSIRKLEDRVIRVDNQLFKEAYIITGPEFFQVFDFDLEQGDPSTVLDAPDKIILSTGAAVQYFGTTDVIGRTIELRTDTGFYQATVGGIVADPPQYSSIQYRILIPENLWARAEPEEERSNPWFTLGGVRFVTLISQTDAHALGEKVTADLQGHLDGYSQSISFQPLSEIHLSESVTWSLEPVVNVSFLYIAVVIGGLILLIACINFTSLTIGQSVRRTREIGMRKAMGAQRGQLIAQLWGETMLITTIAMVGGILLTEFLLPYFGSLVNRQLDLNLLQNPESLGIVIGVVALTGLLAGSYPALYLSSFRPSRIFQSKIYVEGNHSLIRVLTGTQFALAVTLIISTFFMNQQMGLMVNSNPGLDAEYVVQMDLPFEGGESILNGLKSRLENERTIQMISGSLNGLAGSGGAINEVPFTSDGDEVRGYIFGTNQEVPELLDLQFVAGRSFSSEAESASREVIVNQKFVEAMGWEEPVGKVVESSLGFQEATVVGVVQDFHFQSLHHAIGPLVIYDEDVVLIALTRIDGNNIQLAISRLEEAWREVAPDIPFDFTFLDDRIEQQYRSDQQWTGIIKLASIITIVISCMGLFGLATLASVKRAKEIGIRKF